MTPAITILAADTELPEPVAAGWQLVLAALAGIALIVVLITITKVHPFLALIFGALTVGIVAGQNLDDVLGSFGDGDLGVTLAMGVAVAIPTIVIAGPLFGRPLMALLIAVVVGTFTLGRGAALTRDQIVKCIETSLPPVAGIILIVATGGGFKQVLVDSGIGTLLAD